MPVTAARERLMTATIATTCTAAVAPATGVSLTVAAIVIPAVARRLAR